MKARREHINQKKLDVLSSGKKRAALNEDVEGHTGKLFSFFKLSIYVLYALYCSILLY